MNHFPPIDGLHDTLLQWEAGSHPMAKMRGEHRHWSMQELVLPTFNQLKLVLGCDAIHIATIAMCDNQPRLVASTDSDNAIRLFARYQSHFVYDNIEAYTLLQPAQQDATDATDGRNRTVSMFGVSEDVPLIVMFEFGSTQPNSAAMQAMTQMATHILLDRLYSIRLGRLSATLNALLATQWHFNDPPLVGKSMCKLLKTHFDCDAASLIEVRKSSADGYKLRKTFVHHDRIETKNFQATHGYAHTCLRRLGSFLICETDNHAQIGMGWFFAHGEISRARAQPETVEYVRHEGTVDDEASLVACVIPNPDPSGAPLGVLKIADFNKPCRFTLQDAQELEQIASAMSSLAHASRVIRDWKSLVPLDTDVRTDLPEYDSLLVYREIARGVFHELSNDIHTAAVTLKSAAKSLSADDRASAQEGIATLEHGQLLLHEVLGRRSDLKPVATECWLVNNIIRPVLQRYEVTGLEFTLERSLGKHDFLVEVDPLLLRECLVNLIHNARRAIKQYNPPNKRIKVVVRPIGNAESVRILVEDNGIGIPEGDFRRVFDLGYSTKPHGTGVGLYFANRLISNWGGNIEISRSVPGRTIFAITLPHFGLSDVQQHLKGI